MTRFRLDLAYEGTRYDGWQRQGNTGNTIQARVEALLTRAVGAPVEGEFEAVPATGNAGAAALLAGLREYLPQDIAELALEPADPRFHARLDCREKTYVYRVNTGAVQDVFTRRFELHHPQALDCRAMEEAAALLTGRHDYRAFTANHRTKKSTVRTVSEIRLDREGDRLVFRFTGDGFLYNMVRILTGTLIETGEGKRRPEETARVLASLDRRQAGPTAPAHGLTLWEVVY